MARFLLRLRPFRGDPFGEAVPRRSPVTALPFSTPAVCLADAHRLALPLALILWQAPCRPGMHALWPALGRSAPPVFFRFTRRAVCAAVAHASLALRGAATEGTLSDRGLSARLRSPRA